MVTVITIAGAMIGAAAGGWALHREVRAVRRLGVLEAMERELTTAYSFEELEARMRELSGDAPLRELPSAVNPESSPRFSTWIAAV